MTFKKLFIVYAAIMTVFIFSIYFNKGKMYREVLREGVSTKGKVTWIERQFPREGRVRAHIQWSVGGQASTMYTKWEKGPWARYSVGSEVDLIIYNNTAHFRGEAEAVGGGWLIWAGWIMIVGAPAVILYFLGLFRGSGESQRV